MSWNVTDGVSRMSVASAGTSDRTRSDSGGRMCDWSRPCSAVFWPTLALNAVAQLGLRQRDVPAELVLSDQARRVLDAGRSAGRRAAGRRRGIRRALRTARTGRPTARAATGRRRPCAASVSSTRAGQDDRELLADANRAGAGSPPALQGSADRVGLRATPATRPSPSTRIETRLVASWIPCLATRLSSAAVPR